MERIKLAIKKEVLYHGISKEGRLLNLGTFDSSKSKNLFISSKVCSTNLTNIPLYESVVKL